MNDSDFYAYNWNTLKEDEKVAWIAKFCGNNRVEKIEDTYYENGNALPKSINLNFLEKYEKNLDPSIQKLYIENVTNEISAYTYKDMSEDQVKLPSTTIKYYYNLLTASAQCRAKCLYHSIKGEYV